MVDVVVDCDMVIELSCMLFTVTGFDAESVIITLAPTVFPASAEGITHANELDVSGDVPVIPVKSMFATRFPVIVFTIR